MKRMLLACAVALAINPILWCQSAELQTRLNALRKDFDAVLVCRLQLAAHSDLLGSVVICRPRRSRDRRPRPS